METVLYARCLCFRRRLNNLVRPDWFDMLDGENRPLLTERDALRILQAIVQDADKTPTTELRGSCLTLLSPISNGFQVARTSIGVLMTENRTNAACPIPICLDPAAPAREGVENQCNNSNPNGEDLAALCSNFLCGTYDLQEGVQVGTRTNRWYDKVRIHDYVRMTQSLTRDEQL